MPSDSFNGLRFPALVALPCLLTLATIICAVGWLTGEPQAMPFTAALGFLAVVAWLRAPRGFTLRMDDEGLHHSGLNERLAWAEIRSLRLSQHAVLDDKAVRRARFFFIGYDQGEWRLPKSKECDRWALYTFLLSRSRLLAVPAVLPGRLRTVLNDELELFPERVLATAGRAVMRYEGPSIMPVWCLCLAGVIGALASNWLPGREAESSRTGFAIFAVWGAFFGVFFGLAFLSSRARLEKIRKATGMVISPRSLTLEQRDLKGVLQWSEITRLRSVTGQGAGRSGILIGVVGGEFLIQDHYSCPLTEIYRQIQTYWSFEKK